MPPSQSDPADAGVVRLPAHCSTVVADELRVQLVLATDGESELTIDAADVESVGQAVLQLLLAARAEAERAGKPFAIRNPSPAFAERVTACRLAIPLGLEQEGTLP